MKPRFLFPAALRHAHHPSPSRIRTQPPAMRSLLHLQAGVEGVQWRQFLHRQFAIALLTNQRPSASSESGVVNMGGAKWADFPAVGKILGENATQRPASHHVAWSY